jgi:hypothetical protein
MIYCKTFFATLALFAIGAVAIVTGAVAGDNASHGVATDSAYHCPSGRNPYDLHLWIHVKKWCIDPAVRKQFEVKVQMEIHNRDKRHWLDIHQDRIRLVVTAFDRDRWSPPRGFPMSDRPIHTTYQGHRVWAIPANPEGSFDYLPHQHGVLTFATHWHASKLAPGGTFHPHYHYGDLVFYLPVPKKRFRPVIDKDIVGIAYVKNADIIALCPPDTWEEHVISGSF